MLDAELFSVPASTFISYASWLAFPTAGIALLYLLGRKLTRLPFIDVGPDYTPPRWVLPILTIGLLFAVSLPFQSV